MYRHETPNLGVSRPKLQRSIKLVPKQTPRLLETEKDIEIKVETQFKEKAQQFMTAFLRNFEITRTHIKNLKLTYTNTDY